MFKNFLKDPFFHFIFVALFIYIIHNVLQPKQEIKEQVSISKKEIESLKIKWKEEWNRPATDAELKSLIVKKYQDEMLFEEAIAMGLHKEDQMIYERLINKTKYLISNINLTQKPDEKQLQTYYKKHLDNYRKDGKFSFSHLFISIDNDKPIEKANKMHILLKETMVDAKDIDKYGDTFDSNHINNVTKSELIKTFGESFYKQLRELKKHRWSEPIISTLGVHLVFIREHTDGEVKSYDEIKDIVESDFIEDAKKERYENRLKSILKRYPSGY